MGANISQKINSFASIGVVSGRESGLAYPIENPKSDIENQDARVVELADTTVLEAVAARLEGSSPFPGTTHLAKLLCILMPIVVADP
jgi:hypothetical protein